MINVESTNCEDDLASDAEVVGFSNVSSTTAQLAIRIERRAVAAKSPSHRRNADGDGACLCSSIAR